MTNSPTAAPGSTENSFDVVIVGGTPGGIMAAIAAARHGATAVVLERTSHIGGLPANGLGATDIATRGATGGLFTEFVGHVYQHYLNTYGPDSPQARDASAGYHFEPHVGEAVLHQMIAPHADKITVRSMRQFDATPANVTQGGRRVTSIRVLDRETGQTETYHGKVFIDATYEGDLAAAAGAPFTTRREGKDEYNEPQAGRRYEAWHGELGEGSTGEGDDTIQAFNYRVCLTHNPANSVPIPRPASYNRAEYVSMIDDVKAGRWAGHPHGELELDGIGRVTNMVMLPNDKTDANNQHLVMISTDLPEENYPWPTADWAWRDQFADRLRDYILGLFWFAQNDEELPADFRARCRRWGLAKDEYTDNANFPRQVYVREGRRIEGHYLFTARDAVPTTPGGRPPIHASSITASHYALDSHAHHKREPGRVHLDGFLSSPTKPYTVPFGVMVPTTLDNVLTPVPVSGTHIGFSTIRMEPCWMALGQAAGAAASLMVESGTPAADVPITALQDRLLDQNAVLVYVRDVPPAHASYRAVQFFALRGGIPEWEARLEDQATADDAARWASIAGAPTPTRLTTRGKLIDALYAAATSKAV